MAFRKVFRQAGCAHELLHLLGLHCQGLAVSVLVWRAKSLGNTETAVVAAELVAVVVAASAACHASLAPLRMLTDHERVTLADSLPAEKTSLWRALFEVRRAFPFELTWVPAHGKQVHVQVHPDWRDLNNHADRAAGAASRNAKVPLHPWMSALAQRRQRAAKILERKLKILEPLQQRLIDAVGGR